MLRLHEGRLPLLVLFVASGFTALVYEIVWLELLQTIIGSAPVSVAVLLGMFMSGMCLGSLLLSRLVPRDVHPLRVYAMLELAIGSLAMLVLFLVPMAERLYAAFGGYGATGFALRALIAAACLLPPTLAMGATLPAAARWVSTTTADVEWLGFLYAGNIAGAMLGCTFAGFYLLREHDMTTATYLGAAVNAGIAWTAWGLSKQLPSTVVAEPVKVTSNGDATVHIAIALSGFCALTAQVVWTRLLGMLFGATVYTFSIVLAVFLAGMGIGTGVGSVLAKTPSRARRALGWCQLLTVGAVAWAGYMLMEALPYWPLPPEATSSVGVKFRLDAWRALMAILPASILWGASFPLALLAAGGRKRDPGRVVGSLYAANTMGAVLGALTATLLFVPWIGSHGAQRLMMGLAGVSSLLLLRPDALVISASPRRFRLSGGVTVVGFLAVGWLLMARAKPVPGLLVAYGHQAAAYASQAGDIFYVGEGLHASVAVSRLPGGILLYHNAGKIQASSQPMDMRLQRMLGHLTTLVPEQPRSVLVIGCGAGVTAGAVITDPAVEQITIAEIEPLVPKAAADHFGAFNHNALRSPKVHLQLDDARHYLLITKQTFDAITSDPLDPWVKGSATLYTKEFFELARRRLNPGGVITVFVQLYLSTPAAVQSELATFFEVFPDGVVWGNATGGRGYDMVLMGRVGTKPIDLDRIQRRLEEPEYAATAQSLAEVGLFSAADLAATYAGRAVDLGEWLRDAPINLDRNLRLQYLAGLGATTYEADRIYEEILRYRRFPPDLFVASEAVLAPLRRDMRPPLPSFE